VEVEIPITPIEAVKAGLHGSFKAKVKVDVSANYAGIVASMAEELKTYKAKLDEAEAQVETLTEKAAEVDAAKQAEADAKAAAEAAQAEVQKLKETPVEGAVVSNAEAVPWSSRVLRMSQTDQRCRHRRSRPRRHSKRWTASCPASNRTNQTHRQWQ
jgi:hypothetical protein